MGLSERLGREIERMAVVAAAALTGFSREDWQGVYDRSRVARAEGRHKRTDELPPVRGNKDR